MIFHFHYEIRSHNQSRFILMCCLSGKKRGYIIDWLPESNARTLLDHIACGKRFITRWQFSFFFISIDFEIFNLKVFRFDGFHYFDM